MAGIYIHIPYCKQACHYCDFHFSTSQSTKTDFINSLIKEISLQKNYLDHEKIDTIYFGGGTPSLLAESELKKIFEHLFTDFDVSNQAEITLECNPDDLDAKKIRELKSSPINRLSIGIQSFSDKDLQWMNRAHNAQQADAGVKRSQDAGFENITIDLIYALPDANNSEWKENIVKAFALNVQHLSCYSLTVEPRTALAHLLTAGKSNPINEEQSAQQFEMLMEMMKEKNWLHYEISNFACNEDYISKHNSSYWNEKKYLGLGPSAHSFNGFSRQWNVSDNRKYIHSISEGKIPFEKETLTKIQRNYERIMTELRTIWGLDLSNFKEKDLAILLHKSENFIEKKLLEKKNDRLMLTDKGKLIADKIILELIPESD